MNVKFIQPLVLTFSLSNFKKNVELINIMSYAVIHQNTFHFSLYLPLGCNNFGVLSVGALSLNLHLALRSVQYYFSVTRGCTVCRAPGVSSHSRVTITWTFGYLFFLKCKSVWDTFSESAVGLAPPPQDFQI